MGQILKNSDHAHELPPLLGELVALTDCMVYYSLMSRCWVIFRGYKSAKTEIVGAQSYEHWAAIIAELIDDG